MSAAWRRGQGRARVTRNRCTVLERLERRNLLAGDLVLSGLVDASLSGGTPKAAELYVRADVPDLSRYAIGSANNGQGSDGAELTLAGTANAGQFLYVASESTQFESFFGFTPDFVSSALNVNGDDAIELFFDSSGDGFANPLAADDVVSDVFGDIHTDGTGQVWEYMDGWAYRISGTGPDGSSFSPGSWTYSGVNALDGETTNDTAANPFPIGGYSAAAAMPSPSIVINEVDSDTPSTDTEEFIELYDGGVGDSSLDGLVVVLFNGNSDQSYGAYDLAGYTTDPNGFFVLGGAGTPNVDLVIGGSNVLQNGPDAVALFFGTASDFPNGTPLTTTDLVDAVVYATNDGDDHELISAFGTQFDEDANGAKDTQSVSRSPDGGSFTTIQATPGTSNGTVQAAPEIDILGQGISIAAGDTTPSTSDDTDFGQRDIRSDSTSHTFSIDNLGTTTLNIFDITVTGPHAQDFVVGTFANTVDPGSSETFEVTFDPSEVGVRSATITVSNDDSDEATYEFAIQGSGIDVATHVVINEVDSDTPGTDTEEFVELYDGGAGTTALDGLVVVLFNGNSDVSYAAVDLSGQRTDAEGFFVLGSSSVPNVDLVLGSSSLLQNGADAVVLYAGSASGFPSGTPITTANLVDSVVYGTADPDDVELVAAFGPQIDEDANGAKDTESVSRSPDGGAFLTKSATPGTPNGVVVLQPDVNITGNGVTIANGDQTPSVDDGTDFGIALLPNETISRPFTIENVAGNATLNVSQITITGTHASEFSLGPYPRSIPVGEASDIDVAFHPADRGIRSALVTVETNDPDEGSYQFAIQGTGIETAGHVVINEVDADTPGSDTEEFIELFDGGVGNTTLDGLLVVLFNGTSDESYRAFDLSGHATNDDGFFVLGNTAAANVDLDFGAGSVLQNGPDAVALYSGRIGDYPNGTAISTANLLDAVVYATNDPEDPELVSAFGQQVDEAANGEQASDSVSRSPDGTGTFITVPATPGDVNATIEDTKRPQIEVLGNGDLIPSGDDTPEPDDGTDFGSVNSDGGFATQRFTIDNSSGQAALEVSSISVAGPDATDFVVNNAPSSIPAGESAAFELMFQPQANGLRSATVSIANNDPKNSVYQFAVHGTGITVATYVVINEVDADTPGADTAEFIELYDGGVGNTPLDGLVIVLFNGNSDTSYRSIDLTGYSTGDDGLFVLGASDTPNLDYDVGGGNFLQNGPDAVALYVGRSADFPNGTPITTNQLVDAVVYGTADEDDPELIAAFGAQYDESAYSAADQDSVARSPDGAGFITNSASPGESNRIIPQTAEIEVLGNGFSISNGNRNPTQIDATGFGNVEVNAEIYNHSFTIINRGRTDLELGQVTISGGSDYRVTQPTNMRLAFREQTSFLVIFAPSQTDTQTATVSIASSDPDENPFTFQVSGTVAGPRTADIDILGNGRSIPAGDRSPSARDGTHFGLVPLGGSVSTTFELQSLGTLWVSIDGISIKGRHATDFALSPYPITVNEGESEFFEVTFTPRSLGQRSARVTVLNNDPEERVFAFDIRGTSVPRLPRFVINEIDADTTDENYEFIELYDGGVGNVPLDGLVLVLFNGNTLESYFEIRLDGFATDADGFFVVGDADTPNVDFTPPGFDGVHAASPSSDLQNGEDAVALYRGRLFPRGSPVTRDGLLDVVVYETGSDADTGLADALQTSVVDENDSQNKDEESLSRVSSGEFVTQSPSPGTHNRDDVDRDVGQSVENGNEPESGRPWRSRRDRGRSL